MTIPQLTFFCELGTAELPDLFADSTLIEDLVALKASVSLGIPDLTAERAEVVRRLNRAGVPVIAWLLLPKSQGYWFNLGNARWAARRYTAFKAWTAEHDLRWAGVGLDIEPDIREMRLLVVNRWRLLPILLRRFADKEGLRRAQLRYSALVAQIRADGYHVDSYIAPFILDERKAGSTLIQRLGGIVDIPADREVVMLYTSYMRPHGPGTLWSYAKDAQSIGVGSTGGGVEIEGVTYPSPLDWDEFARDLRLAHRWNHDIHVFSLEGCARQGFLSRLRDFDWDLPVVPPLNMAEQVERFRKALRIGLWASAHPFTVLGGVLGVLWLLSRQRRSG